MDPARQTEPFAQLLSPKGEWGGGERQFASRRSPPLFRGPDISLLHREQSPRWEVEVPRGRECGQFVLIYGSPAANSKSIIPGQPLRRA